MAEEFLVVGQVVAAQGLKGEVRVLPASDFPQRFTEPGQEIGEEIHNANSGARALAPK